MVRAKIIYAAVLIGLACFYILYIDSLPLMLLVCALLVPVFLKAGLVWLHFASDAAIRAQAQTCTTSDNVSVTVTVGNRSPLFFPRGEALVQIRHGFGQKTEKLRLKFPVQDRNRMKLTFYIKPARCGVVTITLRRVRIYDALRLFHTNVPNARQDVTLLVLPKPVLLPLDTSAPPVSDPESDRFADKPGDDPSELFGIREYHTGDPVSRIHWKLSSHSDKLFLKEFGSPVEKHALLLLEYQPQRETDLKQLEALLTMLYSLAYQLIAQEHPCTIAWASRETGNVCVQTPESTAELGDAFRLLYASLYSLSSDDQLLHRELGNVLYSSATVFTNLPDTGMLGTLENSISANQRNLVIVSDHESTLQSDYTAIQTIHPDQLTLAHLIV